MFSAKIRLLFIFMIIFSIIINTTLGLRLNPGFSNTEVDWINFQEYSNEKVINRFSKKNNIKQELKKGFIMRSINYSVMLLLNYIFLRKEHRFLSNLFYLSKKLYFIIREEVRVGT